MIGEQTMALIYCPECGAKISDKSDKCVKCGYPLNNVTEITGLKKKKIVLIIALIVVVAIAILLIYFIRKNKKEDGLYNNIAWETSYEDVKNTIEKDNPGEINANDNERTLIVSVQDYNNDKDVSAMILYNCDDDGTLHKVYIMIRNNDSQYSDEALLKKYERELSELYGDGEEETVGTRWTTPKSIIKLIYFSDGYIILDYTDINYDKKLF